MKWIWGFGLRSRESSIWREREKKLIMVNWGKQILHPPYLSNKDVDVGMQSHSLAVVTAEGFLFLSLYCFRFYLATGDGDDFTTMELNRPANDFPPGTMVIVMISKDDGDVGSAGLVWSLNHVGSSANGGGYQGRFLMYSTDSKRWKSK